MPKVKYWFGQSLLKKREMLWSNWAKLLSEGVVLCFDDMADMKIQKIKNKAPYTQSTKKYLKKSNVYILQTKISFHFKYFERIFRNNIPQKF